MGNGPVGKIRRPGMVILLSIVTLGIYAIYWHYAEFQELKDHTGEGIGGVLGLVIALLIGIVNAFLLPAEVGNMYAAEGQEKPVSGVTGFWLLLPLIGFIVWVLKVQGAINAHWQSHGATA
jgi:hypothetical protein